MRYFYSLCVLVAFAVLATGCETTSSSHGARGGSAPDQPPRVIFYKTKAARLATPAWARGTTPQRRDVKLVYDDEVRLYAVEERARHYYDNVHDRFLRYWDNVWQTASDYGERVDWKPAPDEYVPDLLRQRYVNAPPGNPTETKGKGR